MAKLTRADLVAGLSALGLQAGDRVLVHASLAALGEVEGGTEGVIDALLEVLGPAGLLVVPTFATAQPFDRKTSATALGAVPDALWRRPDAVRSLHPSHSVAAIGPGAAELVAGHEQSPTAYADGTPYHKLARSGGKILLLGCDQDRNTTLHTAEALAGAPYLGTLHATYVDDDGREVPLTILSMAGPHRDFIGLDRLFRERGIMQVRRIGGAVCRLLDAGAMLDAALEALRRDPAAVLCDNPACADCVTQRGKIKQARLAAEDFTLAAVAGDIGTDPDLIARTAQGEGISALELTAAEYAAYGERLESRGLCVVAVRGRVDDAPGAKLARKLGVPFVVPVREAAEFEAATALQREGVTVYLENDGAPSAFYLQTYENHADAPALAFNPARFTSVGERPFLQVFYRGKLRKRLAHFYLADATGDGMPALPGRGNGEVKEILSMLRCRTYAGVVTLRSPEPGPEAFLRTAAAFWKLLDTM